MRCIIVPIECVPTKKEKTMVSRQFFSWEKALNILRKQKNAEYLMDDFTFCVENLSDPRPLPCLSKGEDALPNLVTISGERN